MTSASSVRVYWTRLLMKHLSQAVMNGQKGILLPKKAIVDAVKIQDEVNVQIDSFDRNDTESGGSNNQTIQVELRVLQE